MKSKEYYTKLKEQGKIDSEDYTKFIDSVPEYEIPELIFNALQESFLTRERALSDPKIGGKIRSEVYDGVDAQIMELLPNLDVFDADKINSEKDTKTKIKLLNTAITNKVEKVKKANPSKEDEVKELNKNNADLIEKIKVINAEREAEKGQLQKQFETEKGQILLDMALKTKISKFEFAPEHAKLKDTITNVLLLDLKQRNALSVDESGNVKVQEIVNGVAKDKFNGNDPVTIDKLLEEGVSSYLKRNNADDKPEVLVQGRTISTPASKLSQNPTLREMRIAKAQL